MSAKNDNSTEFLEFQKQAMESWLDMSKQFMGQMSPPAGGQFTGMPNFPTMPFFSGHTSMPPMFSMPFDMMNRTMGAHAPFPGDMFKAFMPQHGFSPSGHPLGEHLEQFMATPALGYTREAQTAYQDLCLAYKGYIDALQPYTQAMNKISLEGAAAYQEALKGQSEKIETMRDAYNLWVEVHEKLYADFAMSDEYQEVYGNLINALMRFKKQEGLLVDEYLQSMNIPTKAEVSTLHKRMQETRRELRDIKRQLKEAQKPQTKASAKKDSARDKTAKGGTK